MASTTRGERKASGNSRRTWRTTLFSRSAISSKEPMRFHEVNSSKNAIAPGNLVLARPEKLQEIDTTVTQGLLNAHQNAIFFRAFRRYALYRVPQTSEFAHRVLGVVVIPGDAVTIQKHE